MKDAPLAYLVKQHVEMEHISPGYFSYFNFDARALIVDSKSNLKMTQDSFVKASAGIVIHSR